MDHQGGSFCGELSQHSHHVRQSTRKNKTPEFMSLITLARRSADVHWKITAKYN